MAQLGNIKWGAQYSTTDPTGKSTTKTVNGLNLDESATPAAENANAGTVNELVNDLLAFSLDTLNTVSLIETRPVIDNG